MATKHNSREEVEAAITEWVAVGGTELPHQTAARLMGHDGKWLLRKLEAAKRYGIKHPPHRWNVMSKDERIMALESTRKPLQREDVVKLPALPSGDMPVTELIDHLTKRSSLKIAAHDARRWIDCKVKIDGPIGIAFMGDPHVDDDGCDWMQLRRDLDILKRNRHILTVGMGDYENNWVGRLARLYSQQAATGREAKQLVAWLIKEMDPFFLLRGNHDAWSGDRDVLDWLASGEGTFTADWIARVNLQFRNGAECRVIAAHDFKGNSMWNELHANMRKARETGYRAHIYASGHRHTWGIAHHEDPESNHVAWMTRARGYKIVDSHAITNGYESQRYGHTVAGIIRPEHYGTPRFLQMFACLETAADFLSHLRNQHARVSTIGVDYESEESIQKSRLSTKRGQTRKVNSGKN